MSADHVPFGRPVGRGRGGRLCVEERRHADGTHVPFEAWPAATRAKVAAAYAAKAEQAAERIRTDPSRRRCSCEPPTVTTEDGRCERCWGNLR